jgi:hypothetical protein
MERESRSRRKENKRPVLLELRCDAKMVEERLP